MPKLRITDRALALASRASCDPRTAQAWLDAPESVRPQIAQRIEKAAEQDARPWLVTAPEMATVDDLVAAVPRLVQLSTQLAQENRQLRAEIAELRGAPSSDRPKRKGAAK